MSLNDELDEELVIVRENALRYQGVRTDGLTAHLARTRRRSLSGPRSERRRRAELRSRVRFCDPCGQTWNEWEAGRMCSGCNRLGSAA